MIFPMRVFLVFLPLWVLVSSCSPSSSEDFRYEAAAEVKALMKTLQSIETVTDLSVIEPVLEKHFDKIADIAVRALVFQQDHPGEEEIIFGEGDILSDLLFEEMQRVYAIEGGRECVERAQKEAMLRLDIGEKAVQRLKRKKSR